MTPINRRDSSSGQGGWWDVLEETESPDVVRQCNDNSCGPACAEMLFKSRGFVSVTQEMIISAQGDEWSDDQSLSSAMNSVHQDLGLGSRGQWSAWVNPVNNSQSTFDHLSGRGSYITSLKSFGSESHMVVIDGVDARGRVIVRDPYEGTKYLMEWDEFVRVWEGMSVWWSEGVNDENN